MSWFFGGGAQDDGSTPASRVIGRIRTSELVDERRAAMRALRQLTAEDGGTHAEVGEAGMAVLVAVMKTDVDDPDIVRDALEILTTITTVRQRPQVTPGGSTGLLLLISLLL